jgi:hypothetical protein
MHNHLAAQIASVTSLLRNVQSQVKDRNKQNRPLRLDALGREIDEHGNLVRQDTQIVRLGLNNAVAQAKRKKENPYLAHKNSTPLPSFLPGVSSSSSVPVSGLTSVLPTGLVESEVSEVFDDRVVVSNRDKRGKKALHFAEAGRHYTFYVIH